MFALWVIVCKWLYTKLLSLSYSFCCSFWARCSNVIVNSSLSAAWSHRASCILIIHTKIMIKFCVWFQYTLRPLIDFICILCSFDHLNSTMLTVVEIWNHITLSVTSSATPIDIAVIHHPTASSSMMIARWLL